MHMDLTSVLVLCFASLSNLGTVPNAMSLGRMGNTLWRDFIAVLVFSQSGGSVGHLSINERGCAHINHSHKSPNNGFKCLLNA